MRKVDQNGFTLILEILENGDYFPCLLACSVYFHGIICHVLPMLLAMLHTWPRETPGDSSATGIC